MSIVSSSVSSSFLLGSLSLCDLVGAPRPASCHVLWKIQSLATMQSSIAHHALNRLRFALYSASLHRPIYNRSSKFIVDHQLAHSAWDFCYVTPPLLLWVLWYHSGHHGPRWGTIADPRLCPIHYILVLGLPRFALDNLGLGLTCRLG